MEFNGEVQSKNLSRAGDPRPYLLRTRQTPLLLLASAQLRPSSHKILSTATSSARLIHKIKTSRISYSPINVDHRKDLPKRTSGAHDSSSTRSIEGESDVGKRGDGGDNVDEEATTICATSSSKKSSSAAAPSAPWMKRLLLVAANIAWAFPCGCLLASTCFTISAFLRVKERHHSGFVFLLGCYIC